MIRNNLAALLAERSIKVTTAAMATDLSRNTITSTAQNDGKMIQLETINSLCQYLNITPAEFFSYAPFDVDIKLELSELPLNLPEDNDLFQPDPFRVTHPVFDGLLIKKENGQSTRFPFTVVLTGNPMHYNVPSNQEYKVNVLLGSSINKKIDEQLLHDFNTFWNGVQVGFKSDITNRIVKLTVSLFFDSLEKKLGYEYDGKFEYYVNSNFFIPASRFNVDQDNDSVNNEVLPF